MLQCVSKTQKVGVVNLQNVGNVESRDVNPHNFVFTIFSYDDLIYI